MSEQYTPDERVVRAAYRFWAAKHEYEDGSAEFDRFIARVRTDAAREALDDMLTNWFSVTDDETEWLDADSVRHYRDHHYPQGGTDGC